MISTIIRNTVITLLMVVSTLTFAATGTTNNNDSTDALVTSNEYVKLETNVGDIVLQLYPAKAPITVANFIRYVKDGYYDGTIFHRVIDNFMIQGGGFTEALLKKQTRDPIQNEADNGLGNEYGTIAMARTGYPHSASAQFFINVKNNQFLNHRAKSQSGWGYAVFGKVISGLDTVNKIKSQKTGAQGMFRSDVPVTPIIIQKATMIPKP